ncbi:MAG: sulfatase [Gemmatimonadota bacterium]
MNVVTIVTDSLRRDCLGCYGSAVQTPHLDALAAEGAVFDNAYCENLPTLPMRRAWWTGKYHFHRAGWQPFEPSDYLLAEVLWDRGWTTALVADVYHMHKPVYNCGRGFDTVHWVRGQEYDPWVVDPAVPADVDASPLHRLRGGEGRDSDATWRPRFAQYLRNRARVTCEEETCCARTVRRAVQWLEQAVKAQDDRLFLWVDLFDPHEPWDPPPPYDHLYRDPAYAGPDLVDPVPGDVAGYMTPAEVTNTFNLYRGEVTLVDRWVGVLCEALKRLGLWDRTLVVHLSDHGEPFGEHGYIRKAFPRSYQELVRVPFILRHPQGLGSGRRFAALVQPVDLMPTLLELMDIDAAGLELTFTEPQQSGRSRSIFPQDLPSRRRRVVFTGRSLVPVLQGRAAAVRDFAVGGHHNRQWFITDGEWKYLLPLDGSRPAELYCLRDDPGEHLDLVAHRPDVAARLELALRRFPSQLDLEEAAELA